MFWPRARRETQRRAHDARERGDRDVVDEEVDADRDDEQRDAREESRDAKPRAARDVHHRLADRRAASHAAEHATHKVGEPLAEALAVRIALGLRQLVDQPKRHERLDQADNGHDRGVRDNLSERGRREAGHRVLVLHPHGHRERSLDVGEVDDELRLVAARPRDTVFHARCDHDGDQARRHLLGDFGEVLRDGVRDDADGRRPRSLGAADPAALVENTEATAQPPVPVAVVVVLVRPLEERELSEADDDGQAVAESHHHRVRQQLNEAAGLEHTEQSLDDTHEHHRVEQILLTLLLDEGGHERRDRAGRAADHGGPAARERRDRRDDPASRHADDRFDARDERERDGLRDHRERDREPAERLKRDLPRGDLLVGRAEVALHRGELDGLAARRRGRDVHLIHFDGLALFERGRHRVRTELEHESELDSATFLAVRPRRVC